MSNEFQTVHCRIEGRVQGVWYRAWTAKTARTLGLSGWVRNRFDGSVEALFHGEAATVARMIEACRKGPPLARVTTITSKTAPPPEDRENFQTLGTV